MMKKVLMALLAGCMVSIHTASAQSCPVRTLTTSSSPNPVCNGSTVNLSASVAGGTNWAANYSVASISPVFTTPDSAPTVLYAGPFGSDDDETQVTIPFSFTYYGNVFTSCWVSTNGNIQFNYPPNQTYLPDSIPTHGGAADNWLGLWTDFVVYHANSAIKTYTNGTAPNRKFIVSYENIVFFNTPDTTTYQIALYEGSNNVEVHVTLPVSNTTIFKALGVEGPGGTLGTAAPGRNKGKWSTSGQEAYRFSPQQFPSITGYNWSGPSGFSSSLQNPSVSNVTLANSGTYTVIVTDANGCSSTATQSVTVNPNPKPGSNSPVCVGNTLNLSATNGISYNWTGPGGFVSSLQNPSIVNATGAANGTYNVTVTDATGCSGTATTTTTITSCLTLKAFLQGFYTGNSTMRATLNLIGTTTDTTATDTVLVNLWDPAHLTNTNPDYSAKGILHKNGLALLRYPASAANGSFYVQVRHRNTLETWSSAAVFFTPGVSYDFSSGQTQAYNNGYNPPMMNMGDGVYSLFSGDVNQDGAIGAADMAIIDNDAGHFLFGYHTSDCNGNGASDGTDMSVLGNNSLLILFIDPPY